MTELAGSLSKMSLAELSQLQKFANQPDVTNFQVSHALGAIIDNTGKPYDVITRLGFDAGSISAAESSRNCRRVSSWRMFVGKFLPKVLNIIETESDVVAQNKARIGSLENMPVACVTCERGLARKGSGKHAVCPLGQSFAERMVNTYERVKADFIANLGLSYKSERDGEEVIIEGNEVELPVTKEFVVRIGDKEIYQKPFIFFSKRENPSKQVLNTIAFDLYGIDAHSNVDITTSRTEEAKRIGGFRVGDTILKANKTLKDEGIVDLCAVEMGIFNLCGLPYEYTGEPNLSYALQSMNLVDLTANLKNIKSPKIIDIGAGKGTLACKLAVNLSDRSTITLVELKKENIKGADSLVETNRVPAEITTKIGDIKDMGDNFLEGNTHAVINFGKHYEEYGNNWEAIMTALENSTTLEYVLLGGFEEGESILSLTDKEIARLKAKGYTLAATSKSVPKKGLPKTAYVFTRDI
jgi:predicted RNA methylase